MGSLHISLVPALCSLYACSMFGSCLILVWFLFDSYLVHIESWYQDLYQHRLLKRRFLMTLFNDGEANDLFNDLFNDYFNDLIAISPHLLIAPLPYLSMTHHLLIAPFRLFSPSLHPSLFSPSPHRLITYTENRSFKTKCTWNYSCFKAVDFGAKW